MKFTLSWLKEHLNTTASLQEITDTLTAIGLEVDQVIDRSDVYAPFTVAQITEAGPHPNADKLKLCKVDTGKETLQIVCGASNARDGLKVVLAAVGTVIPSNGMKIKKAKIRDVESNGMLCSAAELDIGEDSAGIIELPEEAEIGKPFASAMGLDDPLIDIDITPNRGDCLGVNGIARDLAAAGLGTLKEQTIESIKGAFDSPIKVATEDEEKCPLFIGRYIRGVKNGESPDWLKKRLQSIGLKPISALVDITNYLTFNFGRPAHVYDAKKLKGALVVRAAKSGEELVALDEKEYTLNDSVTVIADDTGPVAIGGVIGGEKTGCDENTTDVYLEIALFDPISVAKTGRALQIDSDARYRFERSVDPTFAPKGAEYATQLILELCGGEASECVIAGKVPDKEKTISFNTSRVEELIGINVSEKEIKDILGALGFTVSGSGNTHSLTVPSWRHDIEQEADIVEEIARIYGYNNIPATALPHEKASQILTPVQKRIANVKHLLASRGLMETVTFSFVDAGSAKMFGNDNLALANPISSDLDVMRPSIIPGLVHALGRNAARGYNDLALFEVGPAFSNVATDGQTQIAAGVRGGQAERKSHFNDARDVDTFDAKADAQAVLAQYVNVEQLNITRDVPAWYHPGRSGAFTLGNSVVGYFGELHPGVIQQMDIRGPIAAFEVFLEKVPQPKAKKNAARPKLELSNFQSVERDFAFVVDETVEAAAVLRAVRQAEKTLITDVRLFDVYTGKGIEDGKKSLALSVRLQPKDHTLTEEEIEKVAQTIVSNVSKSVDGVLRD